MEGKGCHRKVQDGRPAMSEVLVFSLPGAASEPGQMWTADALQA